MARSRALDDISARWAFGQRCRGCRMDDIAAVLKTDRRTLQREFKRRGWVLPKNIPDENWIKSHFATK